MDVMGWNGRGPKGIGKWDDNDCERETPGTSRESESNREFGTRCACKKKTLCKLTICTSVLHSSVNCGSLMC